MRLVYTPIRGGDPPEFELILQDARFDGERLAIDYLMRGPGAEPGPIAGAWLIGPDGSEVAVAASTPSPRPAGVGDGGGFAADGELSGPLPSGGGRFRLVVDWPGGRKVTDVIIDPEILAAYRAADRTDLTLFAGPFEVVLARRMRLGEREWFCFAARWRGHRAAVRSATLQFGGSLLYQLQPPDDARRRLAPIGTDWRTWPLIPLPEALVLDRGAAADRRLLPPLADGRLRLMVHARGIRHAVSADLGPVPGEADVHPLNIEVDVPGERWRIAEISRGGAATRLVVQMPPRARVSRSEWFNLHPSFGTALVDAAGRTYPLTEASSEDAAGKMRLTFCPLPADARVVRFIASEFDVRWRGEVRLSRDSTETPEPPRVTRAPDALLAPQPAVSQPPAAEPKRNQLRLTIGSLTPAGLRIRFTVISEGETAFRPAGVALVCREADGSERSLPPDREEFEAGPVHAPPAGDGRSASSRRYSTGSWLWPVPEPAAGWTVRVGELRPADGPSAPVDRETRETAVLLDPRAVTDWWRATPVDLKTGPAGGGIRVARALREGDGLTLFCDTYCAWPVNDATPFAVHFEVLANGSVVGDSEPAYEERLRPDILSPMSAPVRVSACRVHAPAGREVILRAHWTELGTIRRKGGGTVRVGAGRPAIVPCDLTIPGPGCAVHLREVWLGRDTTSLFGHWEPVFDPAAPGIASYPLALIVTPSPAGEPLRPGGGSAGGFTVTHAGAISGGDFHYDYAAVPPGCDALRIEVLQWQVQVPGIPELRIPAGWP